MQQSELKHELVLPAHFPLIRLYRLAWGKGAPLDFCHLFWGTLFCWVVPILLVVIAPFAAIGALKNRLTARAMRKRLAKPAPIVELKEPKPRSALLDKIITAMTKFGMWCKWSLRPWWKAHLNYPIKLGLWALMVTAVIGGLAVGLYLAIPFLLDLPTHIWAIVGLCVAGILAFCLIVIALIFLVAAFMNRGYHETVKAYAAVPPMTALNFMRLAYRYVKTNTCPRIVIQDTGVENDQ